MKNLSSTITRKFINSIELTDWEIETDTGWEDITHIHQTIPYQKWKFQTETGLFLECADDHIIFDSQYNEIFVKDLIPNKTHIQTKTGVQLVTCLEKFDIEENMFDITVNSDNHRFYTNDILSHNSLIITALIFGLYGKSNRGTTKKQLVNSTNRKDCLVEVYFNSDGKDYKIIRGISPNRFEIWVDDKLQDELSAVKDQQNYLEQNILKISYKTFMQVVVLGSNNFIPFMQLTSADRRDLVEELLDIKIFSLMNVIIKEKLKGFERTLTDTIIKKKSITDKIEMQRHFIETIRENGSGIIEKKASRILELEYENLEYEAKILDTNYIISEKQAELNDIDFNSKSLNKLLTIEGKLGHKKSIFVEEIEFFKTHNSCPTCKSPLSDEFKVGKIDELNKTCNELNNGVFELNKAIEDEKQKSEISSKIFNEINALNFQISSFKKQISRNDKQIKELQEEIIETEDNIKNQETDASILSNFEAQEIKLSKTENQCKEAIQYFEFANLLMKDGGIKAKVIEQYLPIINQQINKYLHMMDLYINFSMNEEFKESVNTPIHEDFTYGSFSEGEKQKLNLAILFCWRDIARMKNSVNCNLLFLDETFDSSLDGDGTECLMKIINYVLKDVNVFVISHRIDELTDSFERVLEVKKINGFSKFFS